MSDANWVIAIATLVYGAATVALAVQLLLDRRQRESHFREENEAKKLADLRRAFYEAWGYWEGQELTQGSAPLDAVQIGRQFEATVRLECELRLNNYVAEANNLGLAIRAERHKMRKHLAIVGVALGLLPAEYRRTEALAR